MKRPFQKQVKLFFQMKLKCFIKKLLLVPHSLQAEEGRIFLNKIFAFYHVVNQNVSVKPAFYNLLTSE